MHFGVPINLLLIAILPVGIIIYLHSFRQKEKAKRVFGNIQLFQKMSESTSLKRQYWKAALILIALALSAFSLSRPQLGSKMTLMKRRGIDVLVALDTSKSMDAQDIKPSRIEKAKMEIQGLIRRIKGDRIGLIAFAGTAFVQCPLTLDYSAAKTFLDIIDTRLIPIPGTNVDEAIRKAIDCFPKTERKFKVLILLTDGEDHIGNPVEAAEEAAKTGIRIFTIGIGSEEGEPIPVINEAGIKSGYKKDRRGNIIMSKLDSTILQKIALVGNGNYFKVTQGEMELDRIVDTIDDMEKKELEGKLLSQYEDRFQYPLFLAIVLLIAEIFISERVKLHHRWRGRFAL
jgi:Ca-activated chloride channel family protein